MLNELLRTRAQKCMHGTLSQRKQTTSSEYRSAGRIGWKPILSPTNWPQLSTFETRNNATITSTAATLANSTPFIICRSRRLIVISRLEIMNCSPLRCKSRGQSSIMKAQSCNNNSSWNPELALIVARLVSSRPVATGPFEGSASQIFLFSPIFCFKHIIKTKMLLPKKLGAGLVSSRRFQ